MELFAKENPRASIILPEIPPKKGPSYKLPEGFPGDKEVLIVLGLGDGEWTQKLLPWLSEEDHHLIVLEENLPHIHHFFQRIVPSERLHIFAYGPFAPLDKVAEQVAWKFATLPSAFCSLLDDPNSAERVEYERTKTADLLDEYQKFGIVYYRNFYQNIRKLPTFSSGNHLFGKFPGIPAVICGAGPSLDKHLSLLDSLRDKALIFAGGSALTACAQKGSLPHFGAGIDPNPLQMSRFSGLSDKELPFFFRGRFHSPALEALRGPKLYLKGAGGYDTARFVEEELEIEGEEIDEGHNVVNFCVEIARNLGCNPILLVGLDLAYTGDSLYASGVIENPRLEETAHLVQKNDLFGKPVWTEWKWLKEAEWLADYQAAHPELTIKNCTEGGIPIPGIENIPFAQGIETYLQKGNNLSQQISQAIGEATFSLRQERVDEVLEGLKESLGRVVDHLDNLLNEDLSPGHRALAEVEIQEEPAFEAVLAMFSAIWNLSHRPEEGEKAKYLYLRRVAEANLILLREAAGKEEEKRSS